MASIRSQVVVYHAAGCHLCERALAQVRALRDELGFELEEVAIDGSPELEARYREWLPVVELDGERLFVYHVHEGTPCAAVWRPHKVPAERAACDGLTRRPWRDWHNGCACCKRPFTVRRGRNV